MLYKLRITLGVLSLLLVFTNIVTSQTTSHIPYRKGKKWGYSDINKNIIIPCEYNQTLMFRGNYAKVQKGKRWGLINKNGEEVLSCKYNTIKKLSASLYLVNRKKSKSIINVKDSIFIINNVSRVRIDYCGNIGYCCNDSFGIIDTFGNTISEAIFKKIGYFKNGYTIATTFSGRNFLLNCSGQKKLIPAKYTNPDEVGNGRIVYCLDRSYFGVIDTLGNEIIPPIYRGIYPFKSDISVLKNYDNKYELVNFNGEILTNFEYDGYKFDYSTKHIFLEKDSLYGFVDVNGKILIPFKYKDIVTYFNGKAIVSNGKKYGIIDTLNQIVLEFEYDRIRKTNNTFNVTKNNKQGIASLSGEIIIPCEYELIGNYYNGLANACKDGKWGFIDSVGNHIVPFVFENVYAFYEKTFWAKIDNSWVLFDIDLNQISENSYDRIFVYKLNNTNPLRIYKFNEDLEYDGFTLTDVYKKVYFSKRKYSKRIYLISTKAVINGYVSRSGVEYFED
jgi:hypothetical protein